MPPPNGKLAEKKALVEFLISEIQSHESIWNKRSKDYKNVFIKSNSWSEILENFRSTFAEELCSRFKMNTVEGIKAQWKNLREKLKDSPEQVLMMSKTRKIGHFSRTCGSWIKVTSTAMGWKEFRVSWMLKVRGHLNNTWHLLGTFLTPLAPPPPHVSFNYF